MLGEISSAWKHALVTAIPKVAGAYSVTQFRPISIIPCPSKVMESIIREQFLAWLPRTGVVPPEQHGFLPGLSTVTNLVDSMFDWRLSLNQGKMVDVIYIDLSKAFDKVSHAKLLLKLNSLGVNGALLNWFASYLSDRFMTVRVGSEFSGKLHCASGVPQGGVLSPLLFVLYTAGISDVIRSSDNIKLQIYADDIKMYGIYDQCNRVETCLALNNALNALQYWASELNLAINPEKCSVLHIGEGCAAEYSIGDASINECELVKDLGVFVDSKLDFSTHVEKITQKAYTALYFIFRNVCSDNPVILT